MHDLISQRHPGEPPASCNMGPQVLSSGIPTLTAYQQVLGSAVFRNMEQFSNAFLARNDIRLRAYRRQWAADPLHSWSRQWEYPYVLEQLQLHGLSDARAAPRLLDAGSGITFFPYYLASQSQTSVICCDCDASFDAIFSKISAEMLSPVTFSRQDIRTLNFPNEQFDGIYCISVLEHTSNYSSILKEFERVLRPGGLLVVTFDIDLDETSAFGLETAQLLLEEMAARFALITNDHFTSLRTKIMHPDIVTSNVFLEQNDYQLLPKNYRGVGYLRHALSQLMRLKIPTAPFRSMTFCCESFKRLPSPGRRNGPEATEAHRTPYG